MPLKCLRETQLRSPDAIYEAAFRRCGFRNETAAAIRRLNTFSGSPCFDYAFQQAAR